MSISRRYWFLAGIYMGLIFIQSSIPGDKLPPLPISDKLSHLIEFGILSWLIGKASRTSNKKFLIKQAAIFSIIITILYGLSDELHQSFISLREPEVYDVIYDGTGGILAQGIFLIKRPNRASRN
ncbi:MAG: VanZ family protein [bacterium]